MTGASDAATHPRPADARPDAPAADPAELDFPATDADVRTLPNGLEIIVKRDDSAAVASVQAWVRTGSIHEDALAGSGVSHLLEHMVFKGTSRRDTGRIARDVQSSGGYINAYTSFDRTVYWIDSPSESVDVALDVVADLVSGAALSEVEFEREKEVIRREIAMGNDDPGRSLSKLLFATAFRDHPYRHPVIGHLDLFNRLTRDDMAGYYARRYVPNNAFLVIVGDIDPEEMFIAAERWFGAWERGFEPSAGIAAEPEQLDARANHVAFPTEISRFTAAWKTPGVAHPDMAPLDVLASILGGGRSARLFRSLREDRGIVHDISAYAYTPAGEQGLFGISGACDPDQREPALDAAREIIADVRNGGVRDDELARAKKSALASQFATLTSMRAQAADLASNWLATRSLDFTRSYVRAIRAVTDEDAAAAAQRYLSESRETAVSLSPAESLPRRGAHIAKPAAPAIERVALRNGMVLLLREDPRVPLVSMQTFFRGGLLAEDAPASGSGTLLASTLLKGTSTRSAAEIAETIENVGGEIGAASGNSTLSAAVEVMKPDWQLGLNVLHDVLSDPTFPDAEVARERAAQLAAIKADDDHLVTVAFKEARRAIFGTHPYAMPRKGTAESVARLGREDVEAAWRRQVAGSNGILAVFGAIDRSAVRDAAEAAFSALPRGDRIEVAPAPRAPDRPGAERTILRDKEQAVLVIAFPTDGADGDDRFAVDLIDEACSDMASRLFTRIREEQGLAYYVGASQIAGLGAGCILFYLGTSPAQLDHAEAELRDEIQRIVDDGIDGEELERAKRTYLGKFRMELQSPAALARTAAVNDLYGFGHSYHLEVPQLVRDVTPAAVREAARRRLAVSPVVIRIRPGAEDAPAIATVAAAEVS